MSFENKLNDKKGSLRIPVCHLYSSTHFFFYHLSAARYDLNPSLLTTHVPPLTDLHAVKFGPLLLQVQFNHPTLSELFIIDLNTQSLVATHASPSSEFRDVSH